jgi:hypothetical protein
MGRRWRLWFMFLAALLLLATPGPGRADDGTAEQAVAPPDGDSRTTDRTLDSAALVAAGLTPEQVAELGDQVPWLAHLLATGQVTPAQLRTLAGSLLATSPQTGRVTAPPVAVPHGPADFVAGPASVAGAEAPASALPAPDCLGGSGALWHGYTWRGFFELTGYITWGSVHIGNPANSVAYQSAGAKGPGGQVDVGFYNVGAEDPAWHTFAYDTTGVWQEGGLTLPKVSYPRIYIQMRVLNHGVRLTVIDPANWTAVGQVIFPVSPALGLNADGREVRLYRFDSIAQWCEDLRDGSRLTHARWDTLYLYNRAFYTRWVPYYTAYAGPCCSTAERQRVSMHSQVPYHASDLSIRY